MVLNPFKLKKLSYYTDGGTWLIETSRGQYWVDNRFGELRNDVWIDQIRISGEWYNPTRYVLFKHAHPGYKETKIANQYEVNRVLSCLINAVGLNFIDADGPISMKKYELIDRLCYLLYFKFKLYRKYNDY